LPRARKGGHTVQAKKDHEEQKERNAKESKGRKKIADNRWINGLTSINAKRAGAEEQRSGDEKGCL